MVTSSTSSVLDLSPWLLYVYNGRSPLSHGHLDGRCPGAPSTAGPGPPRPATGATGAGHPGERRSRQREGTRWRSDSAKMGCAPLVNHRKTIGKWWFNGILMDLPAGYVKIAMENHHVQWENPL